MKDVYAVVMVGGKGKRLWPLSKKGASKSFNYMGKTPPMIVQTIERLEKITPFSKIRFVIDKEQINILNKTVKKVTKNNIIIEPFGRNTASAIGLAAISLPQDSIMTVFPSDAYIDSNKPFKSTMEKTIKFVNENNDAIVCIGVKPDHPSVDYGYIEIGNQMSEARGQKIQKVKRFVEKPNLQTAKKYFRKNNMLWNAGIYVFKTSTMIEAIKKHAPKLHEKLMLIKKNKKNLEKAYREMDNVSVDYQIMEKYEKLYCASAEFKWSDLGTWKTIEKTHIKNAKKNIEFGNIKTVNCENISVYGFDNKKISVIGLKHIVVVSTDEGVLVSHKEELDAVNDLG
ncbi:MAG: sugar phosphate nucleotidyltransferase, partial [Candidatus Omnitrophica bacterium]|nr:sugar phosphate nucleotidyltransferase [Candidatus Omnitrophota bacterium]